MAIASAFSSAGLTLLFARPMIVAGSSYNPTGTNLGQLTEQVSSWRHETQANGGFWSAEFNLDGNLVDVEDWLMLGLGRHIACYDEDQQLIWAGFVNQVSASLGALSIERGPLLDVANRVEVFYTPIIDPTTDPPITGDQMPTVIAEDTDSQSRWGVIEKILNSGQLLDEEAEQIRDLYLSESKDPKTAKSLNLSGSGAGASVSVKCLGYVHWLDTYAYNNVATPLSVVASDKIEDVLAADPNNLFSTDYSKIEFNGTLVQSYENSSRTAWTILKEIVSLGDASFNRWVLGVYGDERVVYKAVPTVLKYTQALSDPAQRIIDDASKAAVQPWKVKAGEWLMYTDLLIGQIKDTTLGIDPRTQFIESVVFTAPHDLQLTGSPFSTLQQKLNRLGLGGI